MNIEEDIKNLKTYIELVIEKNYCDCNELNTICYGKYGDGSKNVAKSIENVLTAYEKEKEHNSKLLEALDTVNHEKGVFIESYEKEKVSRKVMQDNWSQNVKLVEELKAELEKEKEKNNNVLGLIFKYGQTDGEHHKAWVIDQIVRIITENNYDKWVQHYEYDEETDEDYFWDVGIAP